MTDADTATSSEIESARRFLLPAKLFTIDGKKMVTVLDMASDRIIAATDSPPPLDSIAVMTRSGVRLTAVVDWADDHRIGLRLDTPLEASRIDQFIGIRQPALERALPMAA